MPTYKLAAREGGTHRSSTVVRIGDFARIGGDAVTLIAGPCSVEGREMLLDCARSVRAAGAVLLRGGAFKPRTSPYSFQGLGELALIKRGMSSTGAGVALLDSATSELRRIEFRMTGLDFGSRPRRLEGYTTFTAPSPFIVVPDTSLAVWWRHEPNRRGEWGPADVGQMLYIRKLTWRRGKPPPMSREPTP